jgi:hypothetical protein
MPAFIFNRTEWPSIQRTLYQGLGLMDRAWFPFWIYCTADGRLTDFYAEKTFEAGWHGESVDGSCVETPGQWMMSLDLPAHLLQHVAMTCGFEVHTPEGDLESLELGGSRPGTMHAAGISATILTFNSLDCRGGCGGTGSWFELHSLLWDRASGQVGFLVWYLDASVPGVVASNSVTFPSESGFDQAFPNATWQVDP